MASGGDAGDDGGDDDGGDDDGGEARGGDAAMEVGRAVWAVRRGSLAALRPRWRRGACTWPARVPKHRSLAEFKRSGPCPLSTTL
eukprot:scaffold108333_cov33-Phaeocystis_antarctica.AAC.1